MRLFTVPASRLLYAFTFDLDSETWIQHSIGTGNRENRTTLSRPFHFE